jgi:hypothetical protein
MNQKDLMQKILEASSSISNSSISNAANRGAANHLVVSSFIADKWQDLFKSEKRKEKIKELWGISSKDTTEHI